MTMPAFLSMLYFYNKDIKTAKELNKKINSNNDFYVYDINRSLLELGIIEQEKKGRTKIITLTEKGKQIGEAVNIIFKALNIKEEDFYKLQNKIEKGETI